MYRRNPFTRKCVCFDAAVALLDLRIVLEPCEVRAVFFFSFSRSSFEGGGQRENVNRSQKCKRALHQFTSNLLTSVFARIPRSETPKTD